MYTSHCWYHKGTLGLEWMVSVLVLSFSLIRSILPVKQVAPSPETGLLWRKLAEGGMEPPLNQNLGRIFKATPKLSQTDWSCRKHTWRWEADSYLPTSSLLSGHWISWLLSAFHSTESCFSLFFASLHCILRLHSRLTASYSLIRDKKYIECIQSIAVM